MSEQKYNKEDCSSYLFFLLEREIITTDFKLEILMSHLTYDTPEYSVRVQASKVKMRMILRLGGYLSHLVQPLTTILLHIYRLG